MRIETSGRWQPPATTLPAGEESDIVALICGEDDYRPPERAQMKVENEEDDHGWLTVLVIILAFCAWLADRLRPA